MDCELFDFSSRLVVCWTPAAGLLFSEARVRCWCSMAARPVAGMVAQQGGGGDTQQATDNGSEGRLYDVMAAAVGL
jgi:hypothetical protein